MGSGPPLRTAAATQCDRFVVAEWLYLPLGDIAEAIERGYNIWEDFAQLQQWVPGLP